MDLKTIDVQNFHDEALPAGTALEVIVTADELKTGGFKTIVLILDGTRVAVIDLRAFNIG